MRLTDYRTEALTWHARHPDLSASVFACRFPGHYSDAAVAIRVVKTLAPSVTEEDLFMALSVEQQLDLKRAEHNATVRDLIKTVELMDYYRSLVSSEAKERSRPPAGYWAKEGQKGFVWGLLSDGDLIPKGKASDYDATVAASWAHYDTLHDNRQIKPNRPATAHIEPAAPEEDVDLSDLGAEEE